MELHNVHGDPRCAWLQWPGYWGDTQPTADPLDSFSPTVSVAARAVGGPTLALHHGGELPAAGAAAGPRAAPAPGKAEPHA